jgi:hypothetical protein
MAHVDRKWLSAALIALATAGSLVVSRMLPPSVGVQWENLLPTAALAGSRPVSREIALFGGPALAIVVWTTFRFFRGPAGQRLGRALFRNAPAAVTSEQQFDRFSNAYETILLGLVGLIIGMHAAMLAALLQHPLLAARLVAISIGVSLVVMGNVMPRVRPNWVAGLRTKRTLEDPQLWRSAHRAFGTALVASGLITVLVAVTAPRYGFLVGLGAVVVSLLIGAVASGRRSAQPLYRQ